jgi:hypothetical protein
MEGSPEAAAGGVPMNWLPAVLMPVKQLKLPGDIKARQKQPHVVELSESIAKRTGQRPIHLPTVEYPSKELLSGGDRMAAQLLLGYRSVWVQPVSQLTPQERRDIVRDENLHRRVIDRDALIRQRVEEAAALIELERSSLPPERKPGRPKTARGEAREQVARELGTTPDAVRMAETRAAAPELPTKSSETPPPVETYGLPLVTDGESAEISAYQGAIDDADRWLRRAQAALSSQDGGPFAGQAQRLAADIHRVAADVRAARPVAACPFCKRLPHFVAGCSGCNTSGFVGVDTMMGVADELKLGGEGAMVVALGGRMVSYSFALTGKEPAAHPIDRHLARAAKAVAPSKAKTIAVLDENDKPLLPADDDDIGEDGMPF